MTEQDKRHALARQFIKETGIVPAKHKNIANQLMTFIFPAELGVEVVDNIIGTDDLFKHLWILRHPDDTAVLIHVGYKLFGVQRLYQLLELSEKSKAEVMAIILGSNG